VSDYNFLAKGLALYKSLQDQTGNFALHYLCFDAESFTRLQEYECDSLRVYSDTMFEDEQLARLKKKDRKYYSYALASYFTNYLLNKNQYDITYIDSDIYFHDDISYILEEIDSKEVGVFRHRQYPMSVPNGNGWFNVGVVHFKYTPVSKHILKWWSDAVLYRKYPELATCGDQRYLDAFLEIPPDKLFIDGNIGHGAPWQWFLYNFDSYVKDGCITWGDRKQKLIFSHFSQFEYNLSNDSYVPSTMHHIYTPMEMYTESVGLKKIYDDYFQVIKSVYKSYRLN
jgi:hypothetical protein